MSSPGSISSIWLAALASASLTVRSATSVGYCPGRKRKRQLTSIENSAMSVMKSVPSTMWRVVPAPSQVGSFSSGIWLAVRSREQRRRIAARFDAPALYAIGIAVALRPCVRHEKVLAFLQYADALVDLSSTSQSSEGVSIVSLARVA